MMARGVIVCVCFLCALSQNTSWLNGNCWYTSKRVSEVAQLTANGNAIIEALTRKEYNLSGK